MHEQRHPTGHTPEISPELSLELKQLSNKDLELWSILVLIGIVLTIGFVTLVAPNLVWRSGPVVVDSHFLPQLFSGFIVLIALFNIYLFDQKRRVNQTRDRLIRKLMSEQSSSSELCDPLTKLFSRNYLELLIPKEIARADRNGRVVGFGFLTISNVKSVIGKFGTVAGDHLLLVFSQILKNTLRGSDILARYGKDDFLVLLPDTGAEPARRAMTRVQEGVDNWNNTTNFPYKLEIQTGCAAHSKGCTADEVVSAAKQNIGVLHTTRHTDISLSPMTLIQ